MANTFNPKKFMAEQQIGTSVEGQNQQFDPKAFMQAQGIQTLPNQGNMAAKNYVKNGNFDVAQFQRDRGIDPDNPNNHEGLAVANSISKVSSVGGLGKDLAPFVSALFPTATDRALDRDYGDRILAAKADIDKSMGQSETDHPVVSALTQTVAGIPKTIAMANVLGKIGYNGLATQGGILGGLEGLTQADKGQGYGNLAKQTAVAAGVGAATAGLIDKVAKVYGSDLANQAVDELGNPLGGKPAVSDPISPDRILSKIQPRSSGDFDVKFGKGSLSDAVTLSSNERKLLGDPDLQAKVADDLNKVFGPSDPSTPNQVGDIPKLINQTKQNIGTMRDSVLKDKGALPTDLESSLKSAYDNHRTIDAGGNDLIQKQADNLSNRLQSIEANLRAKSPTASLNDVPLRDSFIAKQQLGEALFGKNQLYKSAPPVRNAAIQLWNDLGEDVSDADPSGQVSKLTQAFKTLYSMEDNSNLSGDKVAALLNPTAKSARQAYQNFVAPLKEMDPADRANLMPELQEYVAKELPGRLNAQAVVNEYNNQGKSPGMVSSLLNKLHLKTPAYAAAGALGRTGGAIGSVPMDMGNLQNNITNGLRALAGSKVPLIPSTALAGALSTIAVNKGQGALNQVK